MSPRRGASGASWSRKSCAACANILPAGRVDLLVGEEKWRARTRPWSSSRPSAVRYEALETTLRQLHPYEVPEIIALPVERGLPDYLRWVSENCLA